MAVSIGVSGERKHRFLVFGQIFLNFRGGGVAQLKIYLYNLKRRKETLTVLIKSSDSAIADERRLT